MSQKNLKNPSNSYNYDLIDKYIVDAKFEEARLMLEAISLARIPRVERVLYASLCRRVSLADLGAKALHFYVRSRNKKYKPTIQECIEYAACLNSLGANREAQKLLIENLSEEYPQSYLMLAFTYFSEWSYEKALPLLRQYLNLVNDLSYEKSVGQVNLAAALIYCDQLDEAEILLKELRLHFENKYKILYQNVLELSVQVVLARKNLDEARRLVDQALYLNKGQKNLHGLFIYKWKYLINYLDHKKNSFPMLKRLALKFKHRETLRECDFYMALATGDIEKAKHVYFGSPMETYRRKLLKQWQEYRHENLTLTGSYIWSPHGCARNCDFILSRGEFINQDFYFKYNQSLHKVLKILCSDFYKEWKLAALYERLYPENYFNPYSSPNVIHQIMHRLKLFFKKNDIPLKIETKRGFYRLSASKSFGILIENEVLKINYKHKNILKLIRKLNGPIKVNNLQEHLQLSRRQIQRILKDLVNEKLIQSFGRGRNSYYILIPSGDI